MKAIQDYSGAENNHPVPTLQVNAVVVTYNGAEWIGECLQSLANSAYPIGTIVVDNGSTDSTLALIRAFPEVICLPQARNLGFGVANNIGIRVALDRKARWVFLLNQDARVEPETIGELVRVSLKYPCFGILSPFHLDGEGILLDTGFADYLRQAEAGLMSDLYRGRMQEVYSTAFVNAAAWLVTRDCLDTVGGFDPLFFMYGEDGDYCSRAKWHGFEIGLVPSAIMFHDRQRRRLSRVGQGSEVESRVAGRFSIMLRNLKQPHGAFVRRLGSWGWASLRDGLTLVGTGQLRDTLAWIIASSSIVVRLPRIWWHRRMNLKQGRHWI